MFVNDYMWYTIPQYKGYEFMIIHFDPGLGMIPPMPSYVPSIYIDQNRGICHSVRSFKFLKRYPKGYYLPYEHKVRGKKSLYYELTNYENLRKRLSVDDIIYLILHQPEQAILMPNDHIMIGNTRNTVLPWERIDRQSSDPHKRESRQNSAGSLFSGLIRKKGE